MQSIKNNDPSKLITARLIPPPKPLGSKAGGLGWTRLPGPLHNGTFKAESSVLGSAC